MSGNTRRAAISEEEAMIGERRSTRKEERAMMKSEGVLTGSNKEGVLTRLKQKSIERETEIDREGEKQEGGKIHAKEERLKSK